MDSQLGTAKPAAKEKEVNGKNREIDKNINGGTSVTANGHGIRQDPTGNLLAPTLDVVSPLSSDPQFVFSLSLIPYLHPIAHALFCYSVSHMTV